MLCACTPCKVCHIMNKAMLLLYIDLYIHVIIPFTQNGATPLIIASLNGHSDIVNILIRNGADINLTWKVYNNYYVYVVTTL